MLGSTVRLAAALVVAAGLALSPLAHPQATQAAADSYASLFPLPGIDPKNFDPTCKACDDFYQFATGGWQKAHPIPAGYPSWGSFSILSEANRNVVHDILEAAAGDRAAVPGSNEQKIGSYYSACMNESAIEAAGLAPLRDELNHIDAISGPKSIGLEIARLGYRGVGNPLPFGSSSDLKDSNKQIAEVAFGGLGLPDRDFYFPSDDRAKTVLAEYHTYVATVLGLGGVPAAQTAADADAIVALETALATATPKRAELRDPQLTYHVKSTAELAALAPDIDWASYFGTYKSPAFATLNVDLPDFVKTLDAQLTSTPVAVWKAYLTFHLLDAYANRLPKAFVDASFHFHSTVLYGVATQLDRWKRCSTATNSVLGEAVGQVYVEKVFPPAAKTRALELVKNLHAALNDDLQTLSWMSPPTRREAQFKLAAMTKKIGYTDHWRSYTNFDVTSGPYAANALNGAMFENDFQIAMIGKPTDRSLWGMTPPTVNAYYDPSNNEIVFPAGILAPPFFSFSNDDAVNYGAIGAVIGHETTHGFDDQGRQFDALGNFRDWWTSQDAANFKTRAQCIIDQFSGYEPAPGVHIQGKLVQGEAIADLGGLTIAYNAFEKTPQARAHQTIDGYTPEQRFFLAYAQVWARNETEQAARQQALTNEHPDAKFRVIGTLSNMPAFRAAFHCLATDKMVRADSCQIW
ncbi:MAG: M13 family metallopeptidase [Candidatus Velthaea sp.]|jgi:predicted metalloendopeptidase